MPRSSTPIQDNWVPILVSLAIATFFIVIGFAAYKNQINNDEQYNNRKEQIQDCITAGGTPDYTFTKDGYIAEYFGCVM